MSGQRMVRRYSEAFKLKVVRELESGEVGSMEEARQRYGITGGTTIQGWLRRLGKNQLLGRVVRVETADEKSELKRLRKQVRDLEHALAQTHMKELINQAYFEIVCEDQGIEDVEGLKKKLDATLSKRRGEGRG
jgi:transposase